LSDAAEPGSPPPTDALAGMLRDSIPAVLHALRGTTVEELRIERAGQSVMVRRLVEEAPAPPSEAALQAPPQLSRLAAPGRIEVRAQVVGVFHRARAEGAPPLAQEGEYVETNKVIGVIETLGLASEVPAPAGGRLLEWDFSSGTCPMANPSSTGSSSPSSSPNSVFLSTRCAASDVAHRGARSKEP
jgi:biotin carboxyl carrier protein